MLTLVPIKTEEQIEWLRVKRNDPRIYRYFRQDAPITPEEQKKWWRNINKNQVRLFVIEDADKRVGYIGFNPFFQYSGRAEFGIFILPEYERKGYGTEALRMLLKKGFTELSLSTLYSDVLDYPRENRFEFYKKLGFEAFPMEHQHIRYKKQGEWINSIKFFMTKDMWEKRGKNGKDDNVGLEPGKVFRRGRPKGRKNKSRRSHPGKDHVYQAAE